MNLICRVAQTGKDWLRKTTIVKQDHVQEMIDILKFLHEKSHPDLYIANISPSLFHVFSPAKGYTLLRGICANERIQAEEDIIVMPEVCLITVRTVGPELSCLNCSVHNKLAMFLYLEARKGDASPYRSYLATLPPSVSHHPLWLPQKLRSCLPFRLREVFDAQLRQVRHGFKTLKTIHDNLKFKEFLYYWLCVNTRSVYFQENEAGDDSEEGQLALAPFLDLLNHSSVANARIAKIAHIGGHYIIRATEKIEKFEQIFISYGDHPDYTMWTEYGFTQWTKNPNNYIPLEKLETLIPESDNSSLSRMVWSALKHDERKVQMVEKCDFNDEELQLRINNNLSPKLSLLINIMIWNPDDRDFSFTPDYENPDFWRLAVLILARQSEVYHKAMTIFQAEEEPSDAVCNTVEFLAWAIDFIDDGLQAMARELDFLLHRKCYNGISENLTRQ